MKHEVVTIVAVIALVLVISIVVVAVALYAYGKWIFRETDTEIKEGFSPKLLDALKDEYGITIPADAVFVKGNNLILARDPAIFISFECPLNNFDKDSFGKTESISYGEDLAEFVCQVLSLDENRFDYDGRDVHFLGDWDDGWGKHLDYSLIDRDLESTYIMFSVVDDTLLIRFVGQSLGYTFP